MKMHKFLLLIVLPLALLSGCGGGSSTSTPAPAPVTPVTPVTPTPPTPPTPTPTANKITVVPALGAFGAGANVAFIKPDGSLIVTAQTNTTGAAVLDMGDYTGPFISRVTGVPGVSFYNEKTLGRDPFGVFDTLLAVVPTVPKASATGEAPSLGVTALTNAAASILITNPNNPKISGTVAETIASQISVANATVAVAAGLPAGVDILSAPRALSSPTDKISATNPAAVAYGAYLAALAQAAPTASILDSVNAMAADSTANKGALPTTAKTITDAGNNLSAVIAANVAATSQTASLTTLTTAFKPDPRLILPESKALIATIATTSNNGVAPITPVVVPETPPVTMPGATKPVVVPPVCKVPTLSSANGTFTFTLRGVTYTGTVLNGVLSSSNAGLNAAGAGSGLVAGTVASGSSSGNDGYVLSSGITVVTGSITNGTAVLNGNTYNMTSNAVTKAVEFSCP